MAASEYGIKISARGVRKEFIDADSGRSVLAIDCLDLEVRHQEFVVIVGPSGCGKSTFLYMVAGFDSITEGELLIDGAPVTKPGPDRGIVFQEYTLYPWRTVLRNITMGLELAGKSRSECVDSARHWIEMTGLEGFEDHYPHTLSGGMKQRVAIARSLAYDPQILLMDEPFGALDAQTKLFMLRDLQRVWADTDKTILFVTHSVKEAVLLADRVVVMSSRPSTVKASIEIGLPRPRDPSDRRVEEFERLLLSTLQSEVGSAISEDTQ